MKYRVTDIQNFVRTARFPTMMEASRYLGMTLPALSESIKRLESDLGSPVFYRSRTGIKLTPEGRVFLKRALDFVASIQTLEGVGDHIGIFQGRSISLGCHQTVASYCIPQLLAKLRRVAPDYGLELKHDFSRNIQTAIQKGELDVGIVINPVRVPDIVLTKLGTDTVKVWQSKDNDEQTVFCDPNLIQTQQILKKWKNKPQKMIFTDSLDLICRLCASGAGYGIAPTRAAELTGLDLRPMTDLPTYEDEIYLVHRPEFGRTAAEKMLLHSLKSVL